MKYGDNLMRPRNLIFMVLTAIMFLEVGLVRADTANPVRILPVKQVDDVVNQPGVCVVSLMAAWCKPCIEELPRLNALHKKYRLEGLRIVGISLDYAGPEAMQPLVDKLKIEFPVYWLGEAGIEHYGITRIPLLLFVRDGRVVRRLLGVRDKAVLEKEIVAFLEKS